jgi:ketosteroid isomerase-like protein
MSADVDEINQLYVDWRAAVEQANIPGYISVLHPEVRLIPPGAEVIDGAENYRAFLGPVFESATYRIEVTSQPVTTVLGDIAVSEYAYVIYLDLKDPGQEITEAGALTDSVTEARYFDVLRKNDEGNWKVWRHTWQ